MHLIEVLAADLGPRRPTSAGERAARERMLAELESDGVAARIEPFMGYASFGYPFGVVLGLGLAPAALSPARRRLRSALALASGLGLALEGDLRVTPISRLLSRAPSGNVVAEIEPSGSVERTLCISAHLDTSRSGLMFHPDLVRSLGAWITAQSLAGLGAAVGEPLLGGSRKGRRALTAMRAVLALAAALLAEREILGEEVAGANDNASGVAVASALVAELAADPPASTRVVLLLTGCEESGTLGMQAFLDSHDTEDWMFLNFDNVGGPGTVRFLRREGVIAKWHADEGMVAAAEAVAARNPELRFAPEDSPAGLTYDSSPVLARGGRGMTISVQDGYIPDLHWPTDVLENVDRDGVGRTLAAGRAMVRAIDDGAADSAGRRA